MTEQEALIALNMVPDVGSVRLKSLLEAFGSAAKIFLHSEDKLKKVEKINAGIARAIVSFPFEALSRELESARRLKVKIVTLKDDDYPENLKYIYGAPLCLYLKGELLAQDIASLAVVGSRRASFYGLNCAERFSCSLAEAGITIVSGLARGIDTQAHKGALKAKGRTIAVLGSGMSCVYPPENRKLADEISERGVVVSEFSLDTRPLALNFPRRNRVISGLSLATLVVEAAKNSGALITADFALEQGRDVFAVPGAVNSSTSFGTNQLIKQGAKLVDSIEDVMEELKPKIEALISGAARGLKSIRDEKPLPLNEEKSAAKTAAFVMSAEEEAVYNAIGPHPRYADEVVDDTGLSGARTAAILLGLEMKKVIKQLPGKMFVRT